MWELYPHINFNGLSQGYKHWYHLGPWVLFLSLPLILLSINKTCVSEIVRMIQWWVENRRSLQIYWHYNPSKVLSELRVYMKFGPFLFLYPETVHSDISWDLEVDFTQDNLAWSLCSVMEWVAESYAKILLFPLNLWSCIKRDFG